MTTLLAPPTATPQHPEWCTIHYAEPDVCRGPNIHLDFTTEGRGASTTAWASLGIGYCPEDGADVFIDLPNMGAAYLSVEDAQRLAVALMSLVATVKRGGVQ